jgi:uncharacterized caspase-like protein
MLLAVLLLVGFCLNLGAEGYLEGRLPNLWILSIGVNRYDSRQLSNLAYAVNDAQEIVNTFKAQEGKAFGRVNSLLIADSERIKPTRANIIDNFSFFRQAGQNDAVILFIAGQALKDNYGYYFLPSDASLNNDGSIRPSTVITQRDIQAALDIPGKKFAFIDTCYTDRLIRTLGNETTIVFTADTGDQPTQEIANLRHGVFTYAILQGLRGEADLTRSGVVTDNTLFSYVTDTVNRMTSGQQQPRVFTSGGHMEFVLARLR